MGFEIRAHGPREGVIKRIQAAKPRGEKDDAAQVESFKAHLIAEVNALPAKFNGCQVHATGETHDGGRTIQSTVIPLILDL